MGLERWAGIGLRQPHYQALLAAPPPLAFVEVHSENFFADGGAALAVLERARQFWPVSLHGVGLSLGAAAGVDPWHLDRLAALVQRVQPLHVSDHACFGRGLRAAPGGRARPLVHAGDLLPVAFTEASLQIMAANVQQVQDRLQRPVLVENLSAYLRWADDAIAEPGFFNRLTRQTGCGLLLDVNNLVVNALNDQRGGPRDEAAAVQAACRWIDRIDAASVGEIHLAGYHDAGDIVIDDHGSRVHAGVWQVYRHALQRLGPRPTLVEWDTALPALPVLLAEAETAQALLAVAARAAAGAGGRVALSPVTGSGPVTPVTGAGPMTPVTGAGPMTPVTGAVPVTPAPGRHAMSRRRETQRQQQLLATLWRTVPQAGLARWTRDGAHLQRGLQAYQAHAGALAERALAAAHPTLQQLLGADSFAALARAHWHHQPPTRGDIGAWGQGLAAFVAASADLADEAYLADLVRLEWAVHQAASAADDTPVPLALQQMLQGDPTQLCLLPRAGTQLVASAYPIVAIWQAHRAPDGPDADRFAPVRQALAEQRAEPALVWRQGWQVQVAALDAAEACFTQRVLGGATLGTALQGLGGAAGPELQAWFQDWLVLQLRRGWLAGAAPARALGAL